MKVLVNEPQRSEFSTAMTASGPVVVPIDEAVTRHLSEVYWNWRRTFESDPHANPLQHPDVVLAELAGGRVRSRLKPAIVCDTSRPHQSQFGILIPKNIRTSQVGGVGPDWTLHGMRLAGSRILGQSNSLEHERRILECAANYATKSNADFLLIEDLDESTPLFHAAQDHTLHGCLLFQAKDFQSRHFIDFPATEAEYWNRFSGHCRKLFRRALKKCANARLERITEIDQIPHFLEAAHHVSKRSWQSQQLGLRIRNDETDMRQLTALAMSGMLRSYLYWIDGNPAAFAIGNQHSGCFRYEETGFCADLRQYSPGRTMLIEILTDLLRHDSPRCFDFGFGDADYKQQFTNRESRSGSVWLVPPTLRARVSLSHLNVCRRLRSAVHTRIKGSSFGANARQWVRSIDTALPATATMTANPASDDPAEISFA